MVLDSGDGVTHVVPVYEGFAVQNGIQRSDVAGRYVNLDGVHACQYGGLCSDVTAHLQLLLQKSGHLFSSTSEREIVRTIKERCCYLSLAAPKDTKDYGIKAEEFTLPDGKNIQVCFHETKES